MARLRLVRALALLLGMAAVLYLVVSLFLPSSRRLIFGVDKNSGKVRMVRGHVTYLPPHQFYRLSFDRREGAAQRDGLVQILSRERVPVTVTYRLRFSIPADRLDDARSLVRDGWSAWIRKRVAEAVSAVTGQMSIEELLSPTSEFATRRDVLRRVVAAHLARSGLEVTAFEIVRIEPDRRALIEYKRGELRRGARGVAGRVAIFAIDGADWELLTELMNDGRLPNLRTLARGGATASLQTIQPMVSPMVWTSMATGLPPDRHGLIDFADRATGRPPDSFARRVPALWEIAEVFGRRSLVVNWWTAWPPLGEGAVTFDSPTAGGALRVHPAELTPRVRQLAIPPEAIQYAHLRRFLNVTPREYENAIGDGASDPIDLMRTILSKTWTDHRVSIALYQQHAPLVTMVAYDGADAVNHLFGPFHPPYREGIPSEAFRRYWPAVANYYAEVDRLIGEWMRVLGDDTTVFVVSAHGFQWGRGRPRTIPTGRNALSDHRNPGVLIAHGNHVAPSRANRSMSIYDVAPTVLTLLGLPRSVEMPGTHAGWLFRDVRPVTSVRVVAYDEFFGPKRAVARGPAPEREAYERQLQAIGHRIDPARKTQPLVAGWRETGAPATGVGTPQWGAYAWHNNEGVRLRGEGELQDAIAAFQKAIDLNPGRPTPYLNLAMVLLERENYTAAENVLMMAVARGLPDAERWFVDFAAYYRSRDQTSRAIAILERGRQAFPQSPAIAANLGSALAAVRRYTEGLPELERALAMQPSATLVLNNLGAYYARRKEYARALDFWNRSLSIDPRQGSIRAAATAAATHL